MRKIFLLNMCSWFLPRVAQETASMMQSCLFVLNNSLGLYILLYGMKNLCEIFVKRKWYKVHGWHNPRSPSFIRDNISWTTQFFLFLSGPIFIHLKLLDFGSILCGLANKLSSIYCNKMILLPDWQMHSLR